MTVDGVEESQQLGFLLSLLLFLLLVCVAPTAIVPREFSNERA